MADKYTFSVEDTLLDALGFLKKMGATMFDAAVRPWRLVINTYKKFVYDKKADPKDPSKNPKNKYISHFLYFVIWTLLFLSYYKAILFNWYNNISMPAQDVIRETNSYLSNTTITEKFLLYFPLILAMYVFVFVLAYPIAALLHIWLRLQKKEGAYIFRRITYYTVGTALMLQLVPVFFCKLFGIEEGGEDGIGKSLRWGYSLYCLYFLGFAILNKGKIVPQKEFDRNYFKILCSYPIRGFRYFGKNGSKNSIKRRNGFFVQRGIKYFLINLACAILFVGLFLLTEALIFRGGFEDYATKVGYLDYSGKISLIGFERGGDKKENIIPLNKIFSDDSSTISLQTNLAVANNWQDIIVHDENALILHCITQRSDSVVQDKPIYDTIRLFFDIAGQKTSDNSNSKLGTAISANSLMELAFQTAPLDRQTINRLATTIARPRDSVRVVAEMNYLPYTTHNSIVSDNVKLVIR
jgi:hypothetical protein